MLSQQSQEGLRNLAPGAKSAGKSGAQNGWFRVGMVTAALGAPLIARWNSLRKRQHAEAPLPPSAPRSRLNALTANAQSALGAAQATLGDRLDDARGAARALVAQSQPRAKAAMQTAQTLVAQSQPRANAAIKTVKSATDAARDLAQTTAKQVAKGRGQLADALDAARNAADAATVTVIKVTGVGKATAAKATGARKVLGIQAATAGKVANIAVRRNIRRNTTLWLTGIGVGVVVTGVTAYVVMRRRMTNAAENDSLVELHGASLGALPNAGDVDRFNQAHMDRDTTSAPTGSGGASASNASSGASTASTATASSPAPTGATAGVNARADDLMAMDDLSALMDDDTDEPDAVLIIETEVDNGAPTDALTDDLDYDNDDDDDDDDDMSVAIDNATQAGGADFIDSPDVAANPAFIGNIHTMIYHPADADSLPAIENQIFFATEEQAIAAGYRRTKREQRAGVNGENDEDSTGK